MPDKRRMLELALKGLEAEQAAIHDEIAQIKSELNLRPAVGKTVATAGQATPPKKKTMSAAARKKISEAMKRRYAEINKTARKASEGSHGSSQVIKAESAGLRQSSGKKQNGGSRLTAAGRKKLSDLMKKRWAERRKGKAK